MSLNSGTNPISKSIWSNAGNESQFPICGVNRALPLISPAYDRGKTEEQVKDRWRLYWRKLWDGS
jgi:hypothetical protein